MSQVLKFSDDLLFGVETATGDLLTKLLPMIREVGGAVYDGVPLDEVLRKALGKYPFINDYFDCSTTQMNPRLDVKEEYAYMESTILSARVFNKTSKRGLPLANNPKDAAAVLEVFGASERGALLESTLSSQPESVRIVLEALQKAGLLFRTSESHKHRRLFSQPGIYRLQHAALLYRSKTTGVISDPHFRSIYVPAEIKDSFRYEDVRDHVDAVLISHSHGDHFDIASLMNFPKDMMIVVPKVPRASLLCDNLEQRLKSLGFTNVVAKDWYSEVQIGDIKIHILPFYGEQATLNEPPLFKDAWNWGNTYVVQTEDFSSWFLIDSGNDVRGTMLEVANHVKNKIGKIDVLLSNLRKFGPINPLYVNNGRNWLMLSTDQKIRLSQMAGDILTLGPTGVAEVVNHIQPGLFLPYAHWWSNRGSIPEGEDKFYGDYVEAAKKLKVATPSIHWKIGDFLSPDQMKKKLTVKAS